MSDKFDFLNEDKHQNLTFLLAIARYAQSTQHSEFVISFTYLKEEGRDEVAVLYADKHQVLL